jgi:uncharacterized membrane protein YgcG
MQTQGQQLSQPSNIKFGRFDQGTSDHFGLTLTMSTPQPQLHFEGRKPNASKEFYRQILKRELKTDVFKDETDADSELTLSKEELEKLRTPEKPKMSWWKKALIATGAVLPIAGIGYYATRPSTPETVQTPMSQNPNGQNNKAPINPAPFAPQAPTQPPKLAVVAKDAQGKIAIDERAIPFVDKASDIPYLNRQLDQVIVDLANNPLLSISSKESLTKLIRQFHDTHKATMQVVVINNTHAKELNSLATDLLNQMQLGDAGINNGVLVLLNAENIRTGAEHNRLHIAYGDGLNKTLTNKAALEIIKTHAIPHLNAKNPDMAVTQTVDAIQRLLNDGKTTSSQTSMSQEAKVGIAIAAIMLLLLALAIVADVSIYQGRDFPLTSLYIHLAAEVLRFILIVGINVASGGSSGGHGGSSSGGGAGD